MKRLLTIAIAFLSILILQQPVQAQFTVGTSYEIRNEDPSNGFGFRIQRGILGDMPILDLGMRAHFSFFNGTTNIGPNNAEISTKVDAYDYGVAGVAGLKLGLVKPYAGIGVGNERFDAASLFTENNFYWNGFAGADITLLPFLHPFIEFRIKNLSGTNDVTYNNVSRLALGINLSF